MQQHHLLFDEVNHIIDVLSVASNQLLFFLQDHFYQALVVIADFVHIRPILLIQLLVGYYCHLGHFNWLQMQRQHLLLLLLLLLSVHHLSLISECEPTGGPRLASSSHRSLCHIVTTRRFLHHGASDTAAGFLREQGGVLSLIHDV